MDDQSLARLFLVKFDKLIEEYKKEVFELGKQYVTVRFFQGNVPVRYPKFCIYKFGDTTPKETFNLINKDTVRYLM